MTPERVIYPPLAQHSRLRQGLTAGEQLVFRMFHEHLPKEWEIYLQPHLNGLRPDFVLLNPNVGIAVFEIKDWNLGAMHYFTRRDALGTMALYAERDGKTFSVQNNNPVTKVNLYKKEIFELYCPRLKHEAGWAAITAGVIFPFARKSQVKNLLSPFLTSSERRQIWQVSADQWHGGDFVRQSARCVPRSEPFQLVPDVGRAGKGFAGLARRAGLLDDATRTVGTGP